MVGPQKQLGARAYDWSAVIILLVLPFVVYLPVTTGNATFAGFDHTGINQPLKEAAFTTMRSGHLPLWEHRLDRGLPLLAEGEAGIFYPLNLLFLIPADFLTVYNLVLLLLLSTAGLLFYWWLRRLGAGPLAAFIGSVAHQWGATVNFNKANMNILEGFILAPLLMMLLEPFGSRDKPLRRGGLIALVFACMIFAGQGQYVVYTGLFALVYVLLRVIFSGRSGWKGILMSMCLPLAIGACLGAVVAAVQLLPTLELIPLSERGTLSLDAGFAKQGLWLNPLRLFGTFIFPAYHYSLDHFLPYLSTTIYVGPIAILLAGYALRFRRNLPPQALRVALPLLMAGLIFLYLAMGSNVPLGGWLTSWGPLAHFRGHGRLGGYFAMAIIALMTLGLDMVLKAPFREACDPTGRRRCMPLFTIELALMAVLTIPFITQRAEYLETRAALGLMLGILMIFFAGFLVGLLTRSRIPVALAVMIVLAVQIVGFQTTSSETILRRLSWNPDRADLIYIRENSPSADEASMIAIRTKAGVRAHERILRRGLAALEGGSHAHIDQLGSANAGLMEGLTVCNADLPLELARWEWLMHRNLWEEIDTVKGPLGTRWEYLLTVLGVNWIVTENGDVEIPGWTRLSDPSWHNRDVPYYIYCREAPVPGEEKPRFSPVRPYATFWDWTSAPDLATEVSVREAFLSAMRDNPAQMQVFIEGAIDPPRDSGDSSDAEVNRRSVVSSAHWTSPTEYSARVSLSDDGIFLVRDAWYPGWSVTVDGKPAQLLRANLVFKAVKVASGTHDVVFKYTSRLLLLGWILSAIGLSLVIDLIMGLPHFRRRGSS